MVARIQPALNAPTKIVAIRPDRLGDVILSTPAFEAIKRGYPDAELTLMVRPEHIPVLQGLPFVDRIVPYEYRGAHQGWRGVLRLRRLFRDGNYRIAILLQTEWRLALALFLARVRYRVGPLSRLHSYLFFNRGIRQRRSQVEMHEADYNLQLLRRIGVRSAKYSYATHVSVPEKARSFARSWLRERGLRDGESLIGVHPGMGGSALNWPEQNYAELMRALVKEGRKVLVTAGPTERQLLENLRDQVLSELDRLGLSREEAERRLLLYVADAGGSIDQLAALYEQTSLVVAPSTGPLHVAVALGKPVVTFYPPIRVQSALRWGPYVGDEARASVLTPEVYCGEDFKCRGSLCNYFPCMRTIPVSDALKEVHRLSRDRSETKEAP